MTLTTHAVIGSAAMAASVAALGQTPAGFVVGFVTGFASHFVIDAIPHWAEGHALLSNRDGVRGGRFALADFLLVSADGIAGLALSFAIFSVLVFALPWWVVMLGALAGQLPDALQFVYFVLKPRFMRPLQRWHESIQKEHLETRYLFIEAGLMVAAVAALKVFI